MNATDFPQLVHIVGLHMQVEISDESLQTLVIFSSNQGEVGEPVNLTLELDELDRVLGVLLAARAELRRTRKDREEKSAAARAFVLQCGGVDAARAALAAEASS